MQLNDKNPRDFESFLRGQLQHLPTQADDDVWAALAARQKPRNAWLRVRHYAPPVAAALAIVLAVSWLAWPNGTPATTASAPGSTAAAERTTTTQPAYPIAGPAATNPQTTFTTQPDAVRRINQLPRRGPWYATNTVPARQMQFQAAHGVRFRNPETGNTVEIPAGVLIYPDGTPVRGAVTLLFREYRSIADYLAAGMPMHYADAQGEFLFNSGGMFEVRAMQNGADLLVAPGKSITVDFAPTHKLRDANFFYLSDTTDQWMHAPSLTGLAVGTAPRVVTEATAIADNRRAGGECPPNYLVLSDTLDRVAWMRTAIQTGEAWARGAAEPPRWFRRNAEQTDEFYMKALERSEIRLVRESDNEQRFFTDDRQDVFTELEVFKNYYFVRRTDSTNIGWRPNRERTADGVYYQDRVWRSVYIRHEGGLNCAVVLTDGSADGIEVSARLARSNESALHAGEPVDAAAIFAEYQRRRARRHAENLETIHRWRAFIQAAYIFQSADEYCLTTPEWFDFFEQNRPAMLHRYDSLAAAGFTADANLIDQTVDQYLRTVNQSRASRMKYRLRNADALTKTLVLSNFGTYNCDQIFRLFGDPQFLRPQYVLANGQPVYPRSTTIILRRSGQFFSLSDNNIPKLAPRRFDIILRGADGRTYHVSEDTYAQTNFTSGRIPMMNVRDITEEVTAPEDWARLLEL